MNQIVRVSGVLALAVTVLGACSSGSGHAGADSGVSIAYTNVFPSRPNRNLDLLFMIDDSPGIEPQQKKLIAQFPTMMNVLQGLPGGLPDLHIGVLSSSLGAGVFTDVQTCEAATASNPDSHGDRGGKFQHASLNPSGCTGPTGTFITANADGTKNNFPGGSAALADVLACIALIGYQGCGFEQPFMAIERGLDKAADPNDPDNGGFLRPDAYLAIVMMTNEDDCSVPADSDLFDPSQLSIADQYGPLESYRCNEFGHLCNGMKPPRNVTPGMDVTLDGCTSAEDGRLIKVADFVSYLKSLKADPKQVFVAAIAPPPAPYTVTAKVSQVPGTAIVENWPLMKPSCMAADATYGDPGVRIREFVDMFGDNGVAESNCADDFRNAITVIAQQFGAAVARGACVPANVSARSDGTPDCVVADQVFTSTGNTTSKTLPYCNGTHDTVPCWELAGQEACASSEQALHICRDPTCNPATVPDQNGDIKVSCSLTAP